MKVTFNKTDNVNGIITIELEKSDYQEKVDKALNQFRQNANIPGFRHGKVPKGLIQKMYGKSLLADEINKLATHKLFDYIKENKLESLGEPLPNESEQETFDFEKDETFVFKYDIALTPEFELPLNQDDTLPYYNVTLEEDLLEKQFDSYRQNFGNYTQVEDVAVETDLLKGRIVELENGEPKEEGIVIENGIIMPSYIKDEETKNRFVGSKSNDTIVFNPKTTYEDNAAEIASLLQTTKEEVEDIDSDFLFEIQEITRFKEAEMNQDLFDKVLGEEVVETEEEFKAKVTEMLNAQFIPVTDNLFSKSARDLILKKLSGLELPDAFLKRWLMAVNEDITQENIEEKYPKIAEDLKYHLAKSKIAGEQNIQVENDEVEALATKMVKNQFANYGMPIVSEELVREYTERMLGNSDTVRNVFEQVLEEKVMEWLKNTIKIENEDIQSKDLDQLMNKEKEAN